jgi:putative SOS response-associated peptidase YedK
MSARSRAAPDTSCVPAVCQRELFSHMCGRGAAPAEPRAVAQAAGVPNAAVRRIRRFRSTQNVHPGNSVPVLFHPAEPSAQEQVSAMTWGLIPSFTDPSTKPNAFKMFNARSETVDAKPVFKRLLKERRCVVALQGFYEWQLDKHKEKQPWYVHYADGRPLLMAALFDRARTPNAWKEYRQQRQHEQEVSGGGGEDKDGDGGDDDDDDPDHVYSFTILTTDTNELSWLHDRQPAIIEPELARRWIDPAVDAAELLPLVRKPYSSPDLVWHPVSKKINNVKYQGDDCTQQVDPEQQPSGGGKASRKGGAAAAANAKAAAGSPSIKTFFTAKGGTGGGSAKAAGGGGSTGDGGAAAPYGGQKRAAAQSAAAPFAKRQHAEVAATAVNADEPVDVDADAANALQ